MVATDADCQQVQNAKIHWVTKEEKNKQVRGYFCFSFGRFTTDGFRITFHGRERLIIFLIYSNFTRVKAAHAISELF